ncbi:MAG TPA: hypothetical protein VFX62_04405 [Erythrobacter sp.]|nr:hypothetical protein [Erythrobacter sp.]
MRVRHSPEEGDARVIEIEVQNETHQTQLRLRFAAVPRIGEGLRLREPDGIWASYDVLDVWYQKAEYGDVWTPYLHIRMTPGEAYAPHAKEGYPIEREFAPFKI